MPFLRGMSRKKIRKKEKYPPKKTSPGRRFRGKRGLVASWTPVSGDREDQDGWVRILTIRII
jgi:hypothetical protein